MAGSEKMNEVQISRQNLRYYDEIASDYDAIMNEDAANAVIREIVAARFTNLVKGGFILDFGGGTGQDLDWLIQSPYRVIFCEPSAAMRQIAIDRMKAEFPGAPVSFFEDHQTDFRIWNSQFPFTQKPDAVLANFAVINCIPDIGILFKKLAEITKPGGIVFALVLDTSLVKRLRFSPKAALKAFLSGNPMVASIEYKGAGHRVYFHSARSLKKATADGFEFNHPERLPGSDFSLIHLVRK